MGEAFRVVQKRGGVIRGQLLAGFRARLGLSQRQAADALALDVRDVEALESADAVFATVDDYERAVNVLERAVGGSL